MAGINQKILEEADRLKLTSIKISFSWIEWLDQLVAMNIYSSRAEAIRDAVDEYLGEISYWLDEERDNEKERYF
ncbi:MAG: ribbon-helix-helix domain-containing protein [Candidatus Odinarchaeota archaeon]